MDRAPDSFVSLHRKCGDLEEELKNVTNNLKSLEAASEKVGGWLELVICWTFFSSPPHSIFLPFFGDFSIFH